MKPLGEAASVLVVCELEPLACNVRQDHDV